MQLTFCGTNAYVLHFVETDLSCFVKALWFGFKPACGKNEKLLWHQRRLFFLINRQVPKDIKNKGVTPILKDLY